MKNKAMQILAITLVLIIAIVIFLIRPVVSSIWGAWKDLKQTEANLTQIKEKKQLLEDLKNNANLSNVADIAEKYIPKEEEAGQLVLDLTAMATNNKLTVEQTSIEKTKAPTPQQTPEGSTSASPAAQASAAPATEAKTLSFSMKLKGSFQGYLEFLKAVETSSRLILISSASMSLGQGADKASFFNVQLSGVSYYKNKVSLDNSLANIKLTDAVMEKFLNLKTYSQPINLPAETGFGRPNPFESY